MRWYLGVGPLEGWQQLRAPGRGMHAVRSFAPVDVPRDPAIRRQETRLPSMPNGTWHLSESTAYLLRHIAMVAASSPEDALRASNSTACTADALQHTLCAITGNIRPQTLSSVTQASSSCLVSPSLSKLLLLLALALRESVRAR